MTDLRDFTSLRVGGPAKNFVEAHNEDEIIAALVAAGDSPVLILGGGTNVLISDAGFAGTVIHITNSALVAEVDACSGATLTIGAGENWDDFVALTIERGFAALETLSGIPGTVGAAPIQNIGAYGHEVSEFITRVRTYDRVAKAIRTFTNQECEFEYRSSIFKKNPGQFIILEVQFQIRIGDSSDPITYLELAKKLDIQMGEKAPTQQVRHTVLELRASKGMLLLPEDRDSWSAGSFFTNPIVSQQEADKLPNAAPKWPLIDGQVKISAAWLIENAGMHKGDEAKTAQAKVYEKFGIKLEPEVNLVGLSLQ